MSHAREMELEQIEEAEAAFSRLAEMKRWFCKICRETPLRGELDSFYENGSVCPSCEARYERLMRH
jgi:rubrerythrin